MKSYLCLITFALLPLSALAQSERLRVGATAGMEAGFTADRPSSSGVPVSASKSTIVSR